MSTYLRDVKAIRRRVELDQGFTLIELLIVIVVLGILAATVIFALSGTAAQSAKAACQSDGKSYEIAAAAFQNAPTNASNAHASSTTDLVPTYLHEKANSTHYVVALFGDSADATIMQGATFPTGAAAHDGLIYVGPPKTTLTAYDSQTSATGCNAVK